MARDREPEPVAAEPSCVDPRPVRGRPRHLPGARARSVEHDGRRGRAGCDRDRPADLRRVRGGRARALPRAPRRAAGHRARSTRTRTSTTSAAPAASSPHEDVESGGVPMLAPAGLPGARRQRERLRGQRDDAPRELHVRRRLPKAGPTARSAPGLGTTTSTGTITLIPPTVDITRTGQEETVDGVRIVFQLTPGTEAPAEMNFLLPRAARAVHRRERDPQPAQHPDPARRPRPRPARSGPATSTRRSTSSAPTPTSSSPPTTGRAGDATGSSTPRQAARPVRVPARPDPAAAQPGLHRRRDRRADRAAAQLAAEWHCRGYYGSV